MAAARAAINGAWFQAAVSRLATSEDACCFIRSPAQFSMLRLEAAATVMPALFVAEVISDPSAHVTDCRFLDVNAAFERVSGLTREAVIGRTIRDIWGPEEEPWLETYGRVALTGEIARFERTFGRGEDRHYDVLAYSLGRGQFACIFTDITERKRAEQELRQREARWRAWISASSQVLYRMSADWSEMLELTGGDFIADTAMPTRDWLRGYIHPDDQPLVLKAIEVAVRSATVFELQHRILRIDGTWGWTESRAVPVRNAEGAVIEWLGAASDITVRKRAEETASRSAAVLAHAGRLANLGAWDIELRDLDDLMRDPLHWSDQAFRIFGYEPGEVRVTNEVFFERVHPDDRARVAEAFAQAVAERRPYSIEHRLVHRDGSERTVYEYAEVILDRDGRPYRVTGAVQDITDRRRAEAALRQANAQLAEADRRKDEFLAMLSHELRNPLAPIRYAIPLLLQESLSDAAARAVTVIGRQVDHLTRLVDDLLDVSRITRGAIELRRIHVPLRSIIDAAVEAAAPAVEAARHNLETRLADEPIWLHADPDRIAQVITNLLNNAAKYTPRGGRIALTADRENGHAVIRVRDSGSGIAPEWFSAIFDMFRQGPRVDSAQGGLGIGLALVKQLVEMHGGTISVHSAGVGHGAEFVVRLPIVQKASVKVRGEARIVEAAKSSRPLKVLIVDDNVDLVEMLAIVVTQLGHDVRKALDGRSAIAAALSYRPDVVLLDLGLPVINGIEVARELRQRPETASARLIALTGWGQPEDRVRTREAGFDAHLTKPTDPGTLGRVLGEIAPSVSEDVGRR